MPINFEGMNDDYITLFDLMEYVERIHQLHNFVVAKEISKGKMEETFAYRNVPVNISRITE